MGPELVCLAMAVYFEARSEPLIGQVAVAEVVSNRVESPRYPDTPCEVVTQGGLSRNRCQFSYWCDGKPEIISDAAAWRRAKVAVTLALNGAIDTGIGDATHYHASYVKPYWQTAFKHVGTIGWHEFYAANLTPSKNDTLVAAR